MKLLPELSLQETKAKGKTNGGDCIVIDSDEDSRDKASKLNEDNKDTMSNSKSNSGLVNGIESSGEEENKDKQNNIMVNGDDKGVSNKVEQTEEVKPDVIEKLKDSLKEGGKEEVKEEGNDKVKNEGKEEVKEEGKEEEKQEVKDEIKEGRKDETKEKGKEEVKVNGCDRDTPPLLESMDVTTETPKSQNPTWSFIDTPDHLDALIGCLNARGFR